MHLLLIDNYDSFTYNLADYLMQTGASVTVRRNDQFDPLTLDHLMPDGICLSPGPGRPADAGALMPLLERWCQHVPVLGICLGHQAIGVLFGAQLAHAAEPVHGKTSSIQAVAHPLFEGLPSRFEVMRYHSLLLEHIEDTPLMPLAYTDQGELMALAHRTLPLWGVQFHPESVLSEHGLAMMQNWVSFVQHHAAT
jgi:anthranilate synthase/aminodeoxychorismate synthase-like glutamine amidotransferase